MELVDIIKEYDKISKDKFRLLEIAQSINLDKDRLKRFLDIPYSFGGYSPIILDLIKNFSLGFIDIIYIGNFVEELRPYIRYSGFKNMNLNFGATQQANEMTFYLFNKYGTPSSLNPITYMEKLLYNPPTFRAEVKAFMDNSYIMLVKLC